MKKFKAGFTLAEVLITLGIIGVVAAITLTSVISKYNEKVAIKRLLKTYSTLQNAFNLAISEHGTVNEWTTYRGTNGINSINDITDILNKYLNITQTLYAQSRGYSSKYAWLSDYGKYSDTFVTSNGIPFSNYGNKFVLNDGTFFAVSVSPASNNNEWCRVGRFCGMIFTDVNGITKGPNRMGYDTFAFYIYPNKLIPFGTPGFSSYYGSFSDCLNGQKMSNCTAWVLLNKNMDYLHCPEKLDYNGKNSCK